MVQMRTRSDVDGPSSGIAMAGEAAVRREFNVCEDDLLASRDAVEALAETRPGML